MPRGATGRSRRSAHVAPCVGIQLRRNRGPVGGKRRGGESPCQPRHGSTARGIGAALERNPMINDSAPPDALLAEVSRDLRAVRPWPTPWGDALRLSPLALGIIVALPMLVGLRRDAAAVGPLVVWGVSLIQVTLGIGLIWMALREGRPARRLPRSVVRAGLAGAGFMVVAVSFLTFSK